MCQSLQGSDDVRCERDRPSYPEVPSCVESRYIKFPINIRKGSLTSTYDGHIARFIPLGLRTVVLQTTK